MSYFNGERNCSVYNEADAVDYVKATHKLGEIEKLFKVPQEIYDSEYGEVGATSLKILRCWIGWNMSEIILFFCVFSITCVYMKIGNIIQNKRLINNGLLGLFIWFAIFIWVPFAIKFLHS